MVRVLSEIIKFLVLLWKDNFSVKSCWYFASIFHAILPLIMTIRHIWNSNLEIMWPSESTLETIALYISILINLFSWQTCYRLIKICCQQPNRKLFSQWKHHWHMFTCHKSQRYVYAVQYFDIHFRAFMDDQFMMFIAYVCHQIHSSAMKLKYISWTVICFFSHCCTILSASLRLPWFMLFNRS